MLEKVKAGQVRPLKIIIENYYMQQKSDIIMLIICYKVLLKFGPE